MIGQQVWTQSIFLGSLHTKECNNEKGGETKPKGARVEGKIKAKEGQISKQDSSANVIKAAAAMSLVSVLLAIILYNSLSII